MSGWTTELERVKHALTTLGFDPYVDGTGAYPVVAVRLAGDITAWVSDNGADYGPGPYLLCVYDDNNENDEGTTLANGRLHEILGTLGRFTPRPKENST